MKKFIPRPILFKADLKQIRTDIITFGQLRETFKQFEIDTPHKLLLARQNRTLKIPSNIILETLCIEKTGQSFKEYFNFKRSQTKPKQIERVLEPTFIQTIKNWCKKNNIKCLGDFREAEANRPKNCPTVNTITRAYGTKYFTETLELDLYKETLEDRLLTDDFKNKLKEWFQKHQITSAYQYSIAKKPSGFPSLERIRQVYGNGYFEDLLGIKGRTYEFFLKEEARQICIDNGIFTSNHYPKFYQKYNETSEKKLPSDLYRHFGTNWANFIQLTETQLFIGNSMSNLELFAYKLFHDRAIEFETEKTFDDCRSKNPLPFDFFLPSIKDTPVIVELDGEHHRITDTKNPFYSKTIRKHDQIKNEYCKQKNIQLIRINRITEVEPTLNDKIQLQKFPVVRDLDWTKDFQTETEVLNSQLPKTIKVKLLLLMAERGKSILSNLEIIGQVNIRKPHFYATKNELIKLGLINRPNEYYFTDEELNNMADLYRQGKTLTEISKLTGYKNKKYLVKRFKEMGVNYKSTKPTKEEAESMKLKIHTLHLQGVNPSAIARQLNISPAFASLRVREYKIAKGEIAPKENVVKLAEKTRQLINEGVSMTNIAKELGVSKQHLFMCLRQTENLK